MAGACAGSLAFTAHRNRIGGHALVLRRGEVVWADGRGLRRILRFERERAATRRAHVGDACREGRKWMQRLTETIERKRLHMILDVGSALRWVRLGKSAKLRRCHRH